MKARRILWAVLCGLLALGGQAAAHELGDGTQTHGFLLEMVE